MASRGSRKNKVAVASAALSLALAVSACGNGSSNDAGGDVDCTKYEQYGELKGKTVTVYTGITAPQDQQQIDSYKPFEKCTGATIKYEGSKEFEAQLKVRVQGGNAPDIAIVPQPGLLKTLVATGKVKPAPAETEKNVDTNFSKDWKAYGTVDGKFYAAPLGANVKSYVWYSPSAFKEKGYVVPETYAEMIALSDKIVADNPDGKSKPWCAGIASGDATGWPATDWMEDTLLRTAGPDVYDQWVKHEIPFNDPKVLDAANKVGAILNNNKYVNGGLGDSKSVATTAFADAGKPITDGSCWMHRQADFYAANWDEGTNVAEDGDIWAFYYPAVDPAQGKPVLGGGEFIAAFADRPEVKAFQTYLSSVEWANNKAKATPATGGWVSANSKMDISLIKAPLDKKSTEMLQDPKAVFRFDGSDLMPGAVGGGTFWKEMTTWIEGRKTTAEALAAIEKSWPKS
jgi:alpha-glucoside transport system substrate-binding protein